MKDKVILTDCDGVLLDWEYSFSIWMTQHGFSRINPLKYNIGAAYGIPADQGKKLVTIFNESAAMGFLPALRDAMYYVKRLHEEHGFVFHCITSLSKDENAQELRRMNLRKLFGKTAFEKFVFLDTGADKDQALEPYRNTGCFWIEDKIQNADVGLKMGLVPLLVEHGHNMDNPTPYYRKVKNWQEIYNIVTGD
jgi:hypothetical protein